MTELSSTYDPQTAEADIYERWDAAGLFQASPDPKRRPYAIVLPPPNVTGSLHMGHALNDTLQDILIRWRRMAGDNTLWLPGTDHGGIATQNVVEKGLKKEGKTRHDLGRKDFLARMWTWRKETGDTILMQMRKLGCAMDWRRTRFTMDEASSKAVAAAFIEFYNQGLIYRGERLVNWCCRCDTALSDIEVEHEDRNGHLWHIRYPFTDGSGDIVVATTRPETLLGDTAVAVNPEDERYVKLVGKTLRLPLLDREIPLVADAAVDKAFGSGAVKVTPSHDATDNEIGARQKLPHVQVIGPSGKMTPAAGPYAGLSVADARAKVVEDLEKGGFLVKTEPHRHAVSVCYRCASVIEPLESSQWFMKTQDLALKAAEATEQGKVKIHPASWAKPYLHWLHNNRDWCISRQIWWGHQIPVWYCPSCEPFTHDDRNKLTLDMEARQEATKLLLRTKAKAPIVSAVKPAACPRCGFKTLIQDPDVLDTWFSSGLWPLTTLGWPEKSPDLDHFYPTATLVTGHEILYLWVARMVMMGIALKGDVPYRDVFIHGIVRDKQGRKMSKSLNNVIDPLDVIKRFGTDALRFAVAGQAVPGRDMQMSDDSFTGARNFANKLWNATRFALMNLAGFKPSDIPLDKRDVTDRWILRRLAESIKAVDDHLAAFDVAQAARTLYHFFWGDFCDWYIELSKPRFMSTDGAATAQTPQRAAAQQTLYEVLDAVTRALHPFMPFITETLARALRETAGLPAEGFLLTLPKIAAPQGAAASDEEMRQMSLFMESVTQLRTLRSEMNVPPGKTVVAWANTEKASAFTQKTLGAFEPYIKRLGKVEAWKSFAGAKPAQSATVVVSDYEIYVPLEGLIDFGKERARLEKEKAGLEKDMGLLEARLNNQDFISRAPEAEVEKARALHAEKAAQRARLAGHLDALSAVPHP
jgi:valyl-tRNA synthetase